MGTWALSYRDAQARLLAGHMTGPPTRPRISGTSGSGVRGPRTSGHRQDRGSQPGLAKTTRAGRRPGTRTMAYCGTSRTSFMVQRGYSQRKAAGIGDNTRGRGGPNLTQVDDEPRPDRGPAPQRRGEGLRQHGRNGPDHDRRKQLAPTPTGARSPRTAAFAQRRRRPTDPRRNPDGRVACPVFNTCQHLTPPRRWLCAFNLTCFPRGFNPGQRQVFRPGRHPTNRSIALLGQCEFLEPEEGAEEQGGVHHHRGWLAKRTAGAKLDVRDAELREQTNIY